MYTTVNFKTKKALREAVESGQKITYYQPGFFNEDVPKDGVIYVEGPHYPEPHKWYAKCTVKNGYIISVG